MTAAGRDHRAEAARIARPASGLSVTALLLRSAASFGSNIALWSAGEALSYEQLAHRAAQMAAGLIESGIKPGDRIGIWMPNTLDAFVSYFAGALAGGVVVPMNTRLTPSELDRLLLVSRPKAIVVQERFRNIDFLGMLSSTDWFASAAERNHKSARIIVSTPSHHMRASTRSDVVTLEQLGALTGSRATERILRRGPGAQDDFMVQFTSGTTSVPKGVVLSHAQCTRMGYELGLRLDLGSGDRFFVSNPIYHLGSTVFGLMTAITHGATYYTLPTFDADEACKTLSTQRCTHHQGIASHYLLELESELFKPSSFHLRVATVGGGPALAARVAAELGSSTVVTQRYGLSESAGAPIAGAITDSEAQRLTTMGRPLPEIEVCVRDPETRSPLPNGKFGQLCLRGWCVMQRYLDDTIATAKAIDGQGWLQTGDLGMVDDAGYALFTSRFVDVLRVGGENVAASEIEQVLETHPAVKSAYVVAVPDARLVEVPYAFLETNQQLEVDSLFAFCDQLLAKFKRPRYFHLMRQEELPMTGSGKVHKAKLRELALLKLERTQ